MNRLLKPIISLLALALAGPGAAFGQTTEVKKTLTKDSDLKYSKKPTIELNPPKDAGIADGIKKKSGEKPKPGEYFGLATKKRFTKASKGKEVILEKFSVLKTFKDPYPYAEYKYIFNVKNKAIEQVATIKPGDEILHGPYQKTLNGEVIEKGIYYIGAMHGRWERYGPDMELLDKKKYYRGLPKDSEITHYDRDKTKVKEIVPIHYGKKDGFYYYYFESGRLAEKGEYEDDQKIGKWYEYYDDKRFARKRVIEYKRRITDPDKAPETIKSWDEKGKVTFDAKGK